MSNTQGIPLTDINLFDIIYNIKKKFVLILMKETKVWFPLLLRMFLGISVYIRKFYHVQGVPFTPFINQKIFVNIQLKN